jgi:hypothetical protein
MREHEWLEFNLTSHQLDVRVYQVTAASKAPSCPYTDLGVYKHQTNGLIMESNKLESIAFS